MEGRDGLGLKLTITAFNFSHIISEMSFGEFYPSLVNPLDRTIAVATANFYRFQYYLSVVPTIYTVNSPSTSLFPLSSSTTIFTNQYAVTEKSSEINEMNVPGIFVKYDIEPILLTVEENRDSFLRFCVKIVNVCSGVLVAGHWGFTLSEWLKEVIGRRRARNKSDGVLNGRVHLNED
jgi:endoplasmic reticulum-Golgi intermediate compartment protein 2